MLFRNTRARNTHVEATLNHSCAAQVNAPGYLRVIWTVVKSWLHPTTAMKVRILGTDRDFARAQMLADGVPEDAVPASCGGGAVEVSLADLFAGSPELAAAYGAPAAAETLEAPRVAAPPRARKAPSDAKKAELAAEAAASTTGYLVPVAAVAVAVAAWYYLT